MTPNSHQDSDLETCSALFDGELQGDAARFALKRLGHDAQWRQACGRWQLVGDVLRGQAAVTAPRDFADRVAAAVAAEPVHAIEPALQAAMRSAPTAAASTPRRSWSPRWSVSWVGGAALAASVALVALFVARPFSPDAAPGSAPTVPATQMAATNPSAPAVESPVPSALTIPDSTVGLAATAVAVAELPRRAAERRSRGQSQRAALRAPQRRIEAPSVAVASNAAVAVNEPIIPPATTNPFHPQQAEVTTRPWPRAVLPNYPATGALTASFGSSTASSPSFYPFEPRLPAGEATSAAAVDIDGPRP